MAENDETLCGPVTPTPGLGTLKAVPAILVIAGSRMGELIEIGDGITIGRGDQASLRVEDSNVSKRHVGIAPDGQGRFVAQDLGSRNGTLLNGRPFRDAVLANGDRIQVGAETVLKFVLADGLEVSFQQQMYSAALKDPLTGLFNRRHLLDQLEAEFSYMRRHATPVSLIILDLDHFKRINDAHGHPVGDVVLRAVSEAIKSGIRREDMAARYGGEEFAVVCRATLPPVASSVAARLLTSIGTMAPCSDRPEIRPTASAGVAGVPYPGIADTESLIGAADRALYRAKESGRNRVILHR